MASHNGLPSSNRPRVRSTAADNVSCHAGVTRPEARSSSRAPWRCCSSPRQVHAAAVVVGLQVLPEVRELQRGTDFVGPRVELRVALSRDAQHQAADRICRSAAVLKQLRPSVVSRHAHVLPERAQEVFEEFDRQRAAANGRADRQEDGDGVGGLAEPGRQARLATGCCLPQSLHPAVQKELPFLGRPLPFVREIVGSAGKRVDRGQVDAGRGAAGAATPPESFRNDAVRRARRRRRRPLPLHYHSTSGMPAR